MSSPCRATLSSRKTTDLRSSFSRTKALRRTFNAGVLNQKSSTTSGSSRASLTSCFQFTPLQARLRLRPEHVEKVPLRSALHVLAFRVLDVDECGRDRKSGGEGKSG